MIGAAKSPYKKIQKELDFGSWVSPGGYHTFKHQWAMIEAFRFHQRIGRKRVAERIHALNKQCKKGLAKMLASLELRERVRSLAQQIRIGEAQILVWLNRTAIVSRVMPDAALKPIDSVEPFVLSITASLRRAGKGVRLVIGNGATKAIDDGLASLIARAIVTRNMFLAGRDELHRRHGVAAWREARLCSGARASLLSLS